MGRLLGLIVVLAVAALIVWLVIDKVPDMRRNRTQRQLYKYNPEMSDLPRPVVTRLTSQQRELDSAARILQAMVADEINVFLPEPHKTRVNQWLDTNQKEISQ